MCKFIFVISWATILVLLLPVSPTVAASHPLDVQLDVQTILDGTQPGHGPFTASGSAVDAGMICATGQTMDDSVKEAGLQSGRLANYQVYKRFICDDGSGEFLLKLQVLVDGRGNNYNWVVIDGTGNYEKLHGVGQGSGPQTEYGVLDLFEGVAHIN